MKKTVLYHEIDGHKIITGFDEPAIDPVETAKIVSERIKETTEYQAVEAKKKEYAEATNKLNAAAKAKDNAAYQNALGIMSVLQDELKSLAGAMAEKITALRRAHAIYFEPRNGEVIVDAEEAERLYTAIQGRPDGVFITLGGEQVHDNRGKVFFHKASGKWQRGQIVRLGDNIPSGATIEADLTDSQRDDVEGDRIGALSVEAKKKEKDKALALAMRASQTMRSELDIKGDAKALEKSQKHYKAETARIEGLYG